MKEREKKAYIKNQAQCTFNEKLNEIKWMNGKLNS